MWQNKHAVMCAVVQQTLSEYYYRLDSKSKARYFEKTVLIWKDDSYAMEKSTFCYDVSLLPALRLVLYCLGIKAVVVLSVFLSATQTLSTICCHNKFCDTGGSQELQKCPKFWILHQWVGSWSWMEGISWRKHCSNDHKGEAQLYGK